MRTRVCAAVAFVVTSGLSPRPASVPLGLSYPAVACAAGTCSLAPLVCANDSSPGCEIICGGEQQAVCVEGSCSAAGNIVTVNRCSCK
jgi:hypothetical protein